MAAGDGGMMILRPKYEDMKPGQWTPDEAKHHLTLTFDQCVKAWPDLMEPYVVQLIEAGPDEEVEIMRRGLRETIRQR
jgi:hypothetical protein